MPEQLTERQVYDLRCATDRRREFLPDTDSTRWLEGSGLLIRGYHGDFWITRKGRQALAEHDAKEGRDGK